MRHRLSAIALFTVSSALAWLPGTAAAAPLDSNASHVRAEYGMSKQTISVKGRLLCGSQPSTSTQSQVQLVNKRVGQDDVKSVFPSSDGTYAATLIVDSVAAMTPEVHILTSCNVTPPQRCRLITLSVPDRYVNSGITYDVGTYNLETTPSDETC